jgi:hypothetical protein
MDVAVGNRDIISGVGQINQTIIVVLVMISIRGHVHVVDPYVGGKLDTDGIAVVSKDLGDGNVADDNICGTLDKTIYDTVSH